MTKTFAADRVGPATDTDTTTVVAADTETATPMGALTGWRRVLRFALVGDLVVCAALGVVSVLDAGLEPMVVVIAVVVAAALLVVVRSRGRAGTIVGGVVTLLLLLLFVPWALDAVRTPSSTTDFVLADTAVILNLVGVAAAVLATLHRPGGVLARRLPAIAGALIGLLVTVGLVAGIAAHSDARQAGDLSARTKGFAYVPTSLEANAGTVSVHVRNDDLATHDFTIDGVVHEVLPGGKAERVVFDVAPGTYTYYCSIHPTMKGTLTVR